MCHVRVLRHQLILFSSLCVGLKMSHFVADGNDDYILFGCAPFRVADTDADFVNLVSHSSVCVAITESDVGKVFDMETTKI